MGQRCCLAGRGGRIEEYGGRVQFRAQTGCLEVSYGRQEESGHENGNSLLGKDGRGERAKVESHAFPTLVTQRNEDWKAVEKGSGRKGHVISSVLEVGRMVLETESFCC